MAIRDALTVINEMEAAGVIGRYAICGAVAAYAYVEHATTDDLDVLVAFGEDAGGAATGLITLTPVIQYLAKRGYDRFEREGVIIADWPVQFLPVANLLDREALVAATMQEAVFEVDAPAVNIRVMQPEHLVALALRVGRPKDMIRVSQFLREDAVDLAALRSIILRHGLTEKWRDFILRTGSVAKIEI